jgi:hypothetical protein
MDTHRTKHEARSHLFRTEGFKELNHKYGVDYDHYEDADKENADKYNHYRGRFYE